MSEAEAKAHKVHQELIDLGMTPHPRLVWAASVNGWMKRLHLGMTPQPEHPDDASVMIDPIAEIWAIEKYNMSLVTEAANQPYHWLCKHEGVVIGNGDTKAEAILDAVLYLKAGGEEE